MTRKIIKYYLFILLPLLAVFSCQKKDTDFSATSSLQAFKEVELHSSFHVYLQEDSVFSIRAVGRQDVIEDLTFTIQDSVLKIEDPRKSEWRTPTSNKVELYISSPPLSKLSTFEACDIKTITPITSNEFGLVLGGKANEANLDLNCNIFYYWSGSVSGGKIILSGQCNSLKLWNTGLMQINARGLQSSYGLVENKSRGTCEVNVTNKFEYAIFNSGDILLNGNPTEIVQFEKVDEAVGQLRISE
ncbi:MAG: hypothetical protein ACJAZ2_001914 [Glaciecola sp.]|jgi:hypothetical protein